MALIATILLFTCAALVCSTPVKRQADWWNNSGSNNWDVAQPVTFPSNPSTNPPANSYSNWGQSQPWGSKPPSDPSFGKPWGAQPPRSTRPPRTQQTPRPTTSKPTSTTPYVPPYLYVHNPPEGCDCPRPSQFNPVCGTDGQTYTSLALLKCFQKCGTNVQMRYGGNCRRSSQFSPVG